jgi:hypothetical protein
VRLPASAALDHGAGAGLADVEGPQERDRVRLLEALGRDVEERLSDRAVGIGDDGVEAAEARQRRGDERVDLGAVGHVGALGEAAPAEPLDLGDDVGGLVGVGQVVDGDVEAGLGEGERAAAADAGGRAGDERGRHGCHGTRARRIERRRAAVTRG